MLEDVKTCFDLMKVGLLSKGVCLKKPILMFHDFYRD